MLSVVPQVYFGEEEKGRHKREVVCRRMKLRKKKSASIREIDAGKVGKCIQTSI